MKATIVLDKNTEKELKELKKIEKTSKSKLIRKAVNDLYLKEKRAKENFLFFVDLYRNGVIDKDSLYILLPRKDAEAIIIGTKTGKEAADVSS